MTDRWFPDSMPNPMVDHHTLPWWQAAAEHRLTVQRCEQCGHGTLPPAPVCSACRSTELNLAEVSGRGTLYTYTEVHQAVSMEQELPFVIAIIELDTEGVTTNPVRMMSNIVGSGPGFSVSPADIGKPVTVAWEDMSKEVSVPRFRFSD